MRKVQKKIVRGAETKVSVEGEPIILGWGDRPWLGGGWPLDGYGPPIHTHTLILDSPGKFIARQSKLWPGGGQCPAVQFSQQPLIHGEVGGGMICQSIPFRQGLWEWPFPQCLWDWCRDYNCSQNSCGNADFTPSLHTLAVLPKKYLVIKNMIYRRRP